MTDGEMNSICGFGRYDQSMCVTLSEGRGQFCLEHNLLECSGCKKRASRECGHTNDDQNHCMAPLCDGCEHRIGEGHGPKMSVRTVAYEELTAAFSLSLLDAAEKGMCTIPEDKVDHLARKMLNEISMHVMMKMLSGIAAAPE